MGDPLRELEEQLESLVPNGLSDQGRGRLEDQIDELAAGVESSESGGSWYRTAGIAAAIAMLAAILVITGGGKSPSGLVEGIGEQGDGGEGIKVVEEHWDLGESAVSRGIVLTPDNEAMHSWGFKVKKTELIFDPESGFHVRVVSEAEEEVLTEVTSF